jgi:phage/plasmid-associated DNA primase
LVAYYEGLREFQEKVKAAENRLKMTDKLLRKLYDILSDFVAAVGDWAKNGRNPDTAEIVKINYDLYLKINLQLYFKYK